MADDPILAATPDVLQRLAENGAQPTRVIDDWCSPHGAPANEWLLWATKAGIVERIYGESDDDPHARWAISPTELVKLARERR